MALRIVVFTLLFLLAAAILLHEIGNDSDIWLHLKTGQYILQNHEIPSRDVFSHTAEGNRWVNHEWLYQIAVYSIFNLLGPDGIILFRFLIFLLICLIIYRLTASAGSSLFSAAAIFAFLIIIKDRLNDRPEMLSLFFTALFILIFERYVLTRAVWAIPPLQLIWANTHGYFIVGLVIILAYTIQAFLRKEGPRPLTAVCLISVAASFLNPNGAAGFFYPFGIIADIGGESKIFTHYINELVPPFIIKGRFLQSHILLYKLIAVLAVTALALNIKKIKPANLIIFCVALAMSLFAIRNIPLFVLVGVWTIAANIKGLFLAAAKRAPRYLRILPGIFLAMALGILFVKEAVSGSALFGVSEIKYPVKATDFLKTERIEGNILNNFFCGSYLIWRLYPEKKVFIDGRTEVYGPRFYRYYRSALDDERLFRELLRDYRINAILLFDPASGPQQSLAWLLKSPEWKIVYFDDFSVIFIKDSEENRAVIDKYGMDLRDIPTAPFDKNAPGRKGPRAAGRINRGKIFAFAGLFDKAEAEAKEALAADAKDAQAYNLLGAVYLSKGDFYSAIDILEKAVNIGHGDENLYYNLGIAYSGINNLNKAEAEYKKALKINPLSQRAVFALALCYERQGKASLAKAALNAMAPKDLTGDINCELGYIHMKERDSAAARKFFEKALKINPNNARAHNGLGLVCAYSGSRDEAEGHFKAAIAAAPNFKEAYDNLGVLYANSGDYERAIPQWEKALEIDPDFIPAREKLERTRDFLNR